MSLRIIFFVSLCYVVRSEFVHTRNCEAASPACVITSVDVENCSHAPRFCRVSHGKVYPITVNFVPKFTADEMAMNTMVDVNNDGSYFILQASKRMCGDNYLDCPLEPNVRQALKLDIDMNQVFAGSVPVLVNLYNPKNATQSCCFTFRVKSTGLVHTKKRM